MKNKYQKKNKRWKKVQERYPNLTEEQKEKEHQYYCEHNLSEEQKQKLVDYRRN